MTSSSYGDPYRQMFSEFAKFALDNWHAFPHYQLSPLEDADCNRILNYSTSRFVHVREDGAWIQDKWGYWLPLAGNDRIESIVRDLVVEARRTTEEDMQYAPSEDATMRMKIRIFIMQELELGSNHVARVVRQLNQRLREGSLMSVQSVSAEDFDNRNRNPIVPVSFVNGLFIGGSVDLRKGTYLDPQDTGQLFMRYHGWGMPIPESVFTDKMNPVDKDTPGHNAMKDAIENRWGVDLMSRLARHMLGTSKAVDVLAAPTNWGKSTMITALEKALPGMVGRLEAYKAFSSQGDRFSQVTSMLATKILVFVDEAGQDDPERSAEISPGALNTFTDDQVTVEQKFKNAMTVHRQGTVILIGHTWAAVNASAQGISTRIKWAWKAEPDHKAMTEDERELILSEDGIEFLRAWMVRRARDLWTTSQHDVSLDDLTITPRSREALAEFGLTRSDPLAMALQEVFEAGSKKDWVASSEIKEIMEDAMDGDKISDRTIGPKMKIAFHTSFLRNAKKNGIRGWYGVRRSLDSVFGDNENESEHWSG